MNLFIFKVSNNDFCIVVRNLLSKYQDLNFIVYYEETDDFLKIGYISENNNDPICENKLDLKKYKNKKSFRKFLLNKQNLGELKKSKNNITVYSTAFLYRDTNEITNPNLIGYILNNDTTRIYINEAIGEENKPHVKEILKSSYDLIQNSI